MVEGCLSISHQDGMRPRCSRDQAPGAVGRALPHAEREHRPDLAGIPELRKLIDPGCIAREPAQLVRLLTRVQSGPRSVRPLHPSHRWPVARPLPLGGDLQNPGWAFDLIIPNVSRSLPNNGDPAPLLHGPLMDPVAAAKGFSPAPPATHHPGSPVARRWNLFRSGPVAVGTGERPELDL